MLNLLSAIANQNLIQKVQMYEYEQCSFDITPQVTMYKYDACNFNNTPEVTMYKYDVCSFDIAENVNMYKYDECSFDISPAPEGAIKVCTLSGAGTSGVNGDYYTDSNNPSFVAKHVSNNYWIKIAQYHMGEGDLYSYCVYNNVNQGAGSLMYEWYCSDGLTNSAIRTVSGTSPAPSCVKNNEIFCIIQSAGNNAVNGVYVKVQNYSYMSKHVFSNYWVQSEMSPDRITLRNSDTVYNDSTLMYYANSSNIYEWFNTSNGTSPAPIYRT